MNNVNLVGRLTRTPELREVNRATSVATIFVATDRPKLNKDGHTYKGDDGFTVKETEYHKVTCFNGLAKAIAGNRKKGDLIAIEDACTTPAGRTATATTATAARSSPIAPSSTDRPANRAASAGVALRACFIIARAGRLAHGASHRGLAPARAHLKGPAP